MGFSPGWRRTPILRERLGAREGAKRQGTGEATQRGGTAGSAGSASGGSSMVWPLERVFLAWMLRLPFTYSGSERFLAGVRLASPVGCASLRAMSAPAKEAKPVITDSLGQLKPAPGRGDKNSCFCNDMSQRDVGAEESLQKRGGKKGGRERRRRGIRPIPAAPARDRRAWVPSRARRSRSGRLATAAPGRG